MDSYRKSTKSLNQPEILNNTQSILNGSQAILLAEGDKSEDINRTPKKSRLTEEYIKGDTCEEIEKDKDNNNENDKENDIFYKDNINKLTSTLKPIIQELKEEIE